MRTLTLLVLIIAAAVFASCVNYGALADAAYARGAWEAAATNYEQAIADAADESEIGRLRGRLVECRQNAGDQLLGEAQSHVAIGDDTSALALAERAFAFMPTPEVQALLRDLRQREGERLLREGRVAFEQQLWRESAEKLERSQALAPNEQSARLLGQARAALEKHQAEAFARLCEEARVALGSRDWSASVDKFKAAHDHGDSKQSRREAQFAACMAEAEAAFARKPRDIFGVQMLAGKYRAALDYGVDQDYVRARLNSIEVSNYAITIDGACVLPFKPVSKLPWDGPGGPVDNADGFLGELGGLAGLALPQKQILLKALNLGLHAMAPPDCYAVVSVGGDSYSNRDKADQDELRPSWGWRFTFPSVNAFDERVLKVDVRDRDVGNDDNVGVFQITLGELVQAVGSKTFKLFDERGALTADGLLAITITVERL